MMANSIVDKKIKYKKIIKTSLLLISALVALILRHSTTLMILYLVIVVFSVTAYRYTKKEDIKRKNQQRLWPKEDFVLALNHTFTLQAFQLIYPICMGYVILSTMIIRELYEKSSPLYFVIVLGLYIGLSLILLVATWYDYKHIHLLYKDGIQIMGFNHTFEEMVKFQFIKLRKGGYLFEGRTSKIVVSFKVTDNTKVVLEDYLSQ